MAVAAALVVPASATAARCDPRKGERVFKGTKAVRLLSNGHAGVVGCHRESGRRTRLTDGEKGSYTDEWRGARRLAGNFVVYDSWFSEGSGGAYSTAAVDLRTGRSTHLGVIQITGLTVERVVLTTRGRLAALRHHFVGPGEQRYDVVICRVGACDPEEEHVVDDGTHIIGDSLRRRGTRACWNIRTADGIRTRCSSLIAGSAAG